MGVRSRALEGLEVKSAAPSAGFWRGRRVLLTGHTGFKGGWAALWLRRLGAVTTGFALAPTINPSLFELAEIGRDLDSRIGDVRSRQALREAVDAAAPEVVLHFAAQPIVRQGIAAPVATFDVNVMGTVNLLEALRLRPGATRILVVTSDKVYANAEAGHAFRERDRLGGKEPYSASKAAVELVTAAYRATYFAPKGVAVATARGGNVVGGGDFGEDRLVPDVVRAWSARSRPTLRMPHATRPWQHVLDCVAGYLVYAERMGDASIPAALNFGPASAGSVTVADLTRAMLRALGAEPEFDAADDGSTANEMSALGVDSRLAEETIGARNRLDATRAVEWTADWYKRARSGENPRTTTLDQIEAWTALGES
ncbi:MAG: CDP-glucose 4,6-dehydratase [Hyphomicrobiales bacterium]|nr:CDP-glucose 4,6-dehydratase [Hyphomicrobiales bacterium]MDE2016820.1 CDP-glucose 4,6-dehydratase [Hyphomicrobiales bacterium]